MIKRILVSAVLFLFLFQGVSSAAESAGEIVFNDAMYGALIGVLIGGAAYLIDQENPGTKLGTGIILGTAGGLIYGVAETRSAVEIKKGRIKMNVPSITVSKKKDETRYSTAFLKIVF